MTSEPVRDPVTDHLLTPQNSALVVIDYQPSQLQAMTSMDRELLVDNVVSVARLATTFALPVVLSTVNVAHDHERLGGPRVPSGGRGDRPQEADHDRAVDRDLPLVPGPGRSARRFRGV